MSKLAYILKDDAGQGLDTVIFLEEEQGSDRGLEHVLIFDKYADDEHIPLQAFFEAGWSVGCAECQRLSDCEDEGSDEYPLPPVEHIVIGDDYFCSQSCANDFFSRRTASSARFNVN